MNDRPTVFEIAAQRQSVFYELDLSMAAMVEKVDGIFRQAYRARPRKKTSNPSAAEDLS
jgi:hypothetical protein